MKSQYKAQIESMLKEQGISFDKIATIFENVYNQTAQDVLNSEGMITGRGARGFSSKGKAYINVKTMLDNFATTFNTNIAKAIDEMNASNKDMDTIDIDYSQAGKDENGNAINVFGSDKSVEELYNSNGTVTKTSIFGAVIYKQRFKIQAKQMVNNMQTQMLHKANAMCKANGVTFDNESFTTIFNNAREVSVNSGVTRNYFTTNFNVKTLLDTFVENFKTNYTTWVETEANKAKNKQ